MRKWILLLIFLGSCLTLQAQDNSSSSILIGPGEQLPYQEKSKFKGLKKSIIKWKKIIPNEWLDISQWKKELALKEKEPNWRRNLIERGLREIAGRVIECVGDCRVYRGLGFARVQYKSGIREGDEIVTLKDSYLWIYLLDGTLVRLAPSSSITMKEINIGREDNFLHARINSGNVLWLSREKNQYKLKPNKETDVLFLPLAYYDANPPLEQIEIDEKDLFASIVDDQVNLKKYKRLNSLIEENNDSFFKKETFSFLVFPNGTVTGKNLSTEFMVLTGGDTFFKNRLPTQVGLSGETKERGLTFYYRGFENREKKSLESGSWYKVDPKGRDISEYLDYQKFGMGEFLTSNIPSILVARELMAKRYSPFAHEDIDIDTLARDHGYRQWGSLDNDRNEDLAQRVRYLVEYTRRLETSNLLVREQFVRRMQEQGEEIANAEFNYDYIRKAVATYYIYKDSQKLISTDRDHLNSTKNPFWKRIHGYK